MTRRERSQPSSRSVALAALARWRDSGRFADEILHDLLPEPQLESRDRAFALELFYGVLRNLSLLDYWIDLLTTRSMQPGVRDALRLGLYQLLLLRTSAHAALNETVNLVPQRARGFLNAILRRAQRDEGDLRKRAGAEPLHIRTSHPEFLVARWQKQFGREQAEQLCLWNNTPPAIFARINTLVPGADELLSRYPEARLTQHPLFFQFESLPLDALKAGHCYVQDPSTALACELLAPQPGESVLDACAAPGGKTTYLAQLMRNTGRIMACDAVESRRQRLLSNVERLQAKNVVVQQVDWLSPEPHLPETALRFDRILADVPCTNTGVIRRRVDLRWRLAVADFARMAAQQIRIVENAARLLKSNGTLVYSTCSMEPEENQSVVRELLARNPDLELRQEQALLPFRDGCDGAYVAVLHLRER